MTLEGEEAKWYWAEVGGPCQMSLRGKWLEGSIMDGYEVNGRKVAAWMSLKK